MPVYWGNRMRRGVWTKNWHWYAAMAARLCNLFIGNGLRTGAEIAHDNEKAMRAAGLRRVGFRPLTLPSKRDDGLLKPVSFARVNGIRLTPMKLRPAKLSAYPKVTVVCVSCGKKFKRDDPSSELRAHKDPYGLPCDCKTGYTAF